MSGPHWLRAPGATSTPPVIVSFDTETKVTVTDGQEALILRCWDAIVRIRDADLAAEIEPWPQAGETPGELAAVLESAASLTGEAWAFAHNAGFDLTVTSLPMILSERGWEPKFVNLGDETCVFALRRDGQRLVITDSWSWLRCGLQTAAGDVGMRKTRLPDDDEDLAVWHHRCQHDARILDALISRLMDWWDGQDAGAFGVTGASCGWRTLRAHVKPRSMLVGPDPPRTLLERQALYGGRKEVWQVGRSRRHWVEDWDLVAAHLTTVANLPLPSRPIPARRVAAGVSPLQPPDGAGAVCHVQITTDVPCAPVRLGDDVWWPVGTFRTVLTSAELPAVLEQAADVRVLSAQWYELDDSLAGWARWCLGLQADPETVTPRVVKRVAKGWGRSVPGRFALRTSRLIREQPATHLGWQLETGFDLDSGDPIETLTYGGVARTFRRDVDGQDCSPVVLAFVEGYVRAAMSRIIAARDPSRLLQVNTDGWWEIRHGRGWPAPEEVTPWPYSTVRKAVTRDVTVIGPNHTDAPGDRRLAGVPVTAERRLDGSFAWQDWPGLRWQLQHSRPGEFVRPGREMLLEDHYCRRWVLATGETVPVSAAVSPSGQTMLLPWSETACRRGGDVLAEHQVPALALLRDENQPYRGSGAPGAGPALGRRQPPAS